MSASGWAPENLNSAQPLRRPCHRKPMFSRQKISVATMTALAAWCVAAPGLAGPQDEPTQTPREALALVAGGDLVLHDAAIIRVSTNLAPGAVITSPLRITGIAEGGLFQEGVFPIYLMGEEGCVLARLPARPLTDWMTGGEVAFEATLVFSAPPGSRATLVFEGGCRIRECAGAPGRANAGDGSSRRRETEHLVPRPEDCTDSGGRSPATATSLATPRLPSPPCCPASRPPGPPAPRP